MEIISGNNGIESVMAVQCNCSCAGQCSCTYGVYSTSYYSVLGGESHQAFVKLNP